MGTVCMLYGVVPPLPPQVLQYKLRQVREACTKLEDGYQPGITFMHGGAEETPHTSLLHQFAGRWSGVGMQWDGWMEMWSCVGCMWWVQDECIECAC